VSPRGCSDGSSSFFCSARLHIDVSHREPSRGRLVQKSRVRSELHSFASRLAIECGAFASAHATMCRPKACQ
jgi:hypothetical protein